MGLYVGQGYGHKTWLPGDPGKPATADSKQELVSWCPAPSTSPCSMSECRNQAPVRPSLSRGRWYWHKDPACARCCCLRRYHDLELIELIAMWEAQGRRCYRYPDCSRTLIDPRLSSDGRRAQEGDAWNIRIDHDHLKCPKRNHSCKHCYRGLACHDCNVNELSRRLGEACLPEGDKERHRWLKSLGPEERDWLRQGLTLFPEQPVRTASRRRSRHERAAGNVIPLFDLDAG